MRFSNQFRLNKSQAELDFVDIDGRQDLPLFLDPYAIAKRDDAWSVACNDDIVDFFSTLLVEIKAKRKSKGVALLSKLNEPNETCLGVSKGTPSGRGVGAIQAERLYEAFAASKAARTGLLKDLSDAELFIEGIGPDKISDMTTNILRRQLIKYTQSQCELHGVGLVGASPTGPIWLSERHEWDQTYEALPILDDKPVLLVPKRAVRFSLSIIPAKFYRHFVLDFLREENLRLNTSLVVVLKNGKRRVYKKDVAEAKPFSKDFLADFVKEHPKVLDEYRDAIGVPIPLSASELDESFNEKAFALVLSDRLKAIPAGRDAAADFHKLMVGIATFLFFPHLSNPIKECEIHEGRKRIDISFVNAAESGIFRRFQVDPEFIARFIAVECKNYSKDIANPELDQMIGRFSRLRGKVGIIVCRKLEDKALFEKRLRDVAKDGQGFILVFDDGDILKMLEMISAGRRAAIENYLVGKFRSIFES